MRLMTTAPLLATSMLSGIPAFAADKTVLRETKVIPDSKQSTERLSQLSGAKIVSMYGDAKAVKVLRNGDVERVWDLPAGQLHMTNRPNGGKVTSVKFYENVKTNVRAATVRTDF